MNVPGLWKRAAIEVGLALERRGRRRWGRFRRHVRAQAIEGRRLLARGRELHQQGWDGDPLVSVLIPTYNRAQLLCERTIPSVLAQTYKNFELIIVGDQCTDDTEARIRSIGDPRIRFVNLPQRGQYPVRKFDRWRVAGVVPANHALRMAKGTWRAPLDDDDEFTPDHIESLLREAQRRRLEMVYGKVRAQTFLGAWRMIGSWPLREKRISRISVLTHASLDAFEYDIEAWRFSEPADWNLWRRIRDAGARIGFVDHVVGIHHMEGVQRQGG